MKKAKIGSSNAIAGPMPSKDHEAREKRYQGEDDLRTLTRGDEIRQDKSRMLNVRGVHRDQMSALQRMGSSLSGRSAKGRGKTGRKRPGGFRRR